jgi:hypothetical protein
VVYACHRVATPILLMQIRSCGSCRGRIDEPTAAINVLMQAVQANLHPGPRPRYLC